ncbi:M1 family metallopeptidase [Clostridiaceae bacterium M8S5]|nr:M1 family metallopeptidase [Clostridiaceae bacterium M8S5]
MRFIKKRKALFLFCLFMIFIAYFDNMANNDGTLEKIKEECKISLVTNKQKKSEIDKKAIIQKDIPLDTKRVNNYKIDVKLNDDKNKLSVKQTVNYCNNESVVLENLYFHIYPNAFNNKRTAPMIYKTAINSYPTGFSPGNITIKSITIEDKKASYTIEGSDKTLLKIELSKALNQSERVTINIEYDVIIPCAKGRFGYYKDVYNLGNWYPIACVFDKNGWNLEPYYNIGDPFYSDTSNYEVTICAPKKIIVASSGDLENEIEEGDYTYWQFKADLRRDFAFVASKRFTVMEEMVDDILIKSYYLSKDKGINKKVMKFAKNSIQIFGKIYGKYPFKTYSVVETYFPTGMEYPALVYIGQELYNENNVRFLEVVVAHETGHQWWYSAVGNDQVDEPWLDESLTTYSEVVYFDELMGDKKGEEYFNNSIKKQYDRVKNRIKDKRIVKPLKEFNDWVDYGGIVYNKGAMYLHEIEKKYGEEVLYKILRNYYNKYKYQNASTPDFTDICEEYTDEYMKDITKKWLYN